MNEWCQEVIMKKACHQRINKPIITTTITTITTTIQSNPIQSNPTQLHRRMKVEFILCIFLVGFISIDSFSSYELHSSRTIIKLYNTKEEQPNNLHTRRKLFPLLSSYTLLLPLITTTTTTTTTTLLEPERCNAISSVDAEVSYNKYAKTYDELDGGSIASKLGIEDERNNIIKQASGNVLEVAVGTGLNLSKYVFASSPSAADGGVKSLTLLDISDGMLLEAKAKLDSMDIPSHVTINLIKADATTSDITELFGENSFDTVLDTFSLCVMGNEGAKKCLEQMRNVVKNESDGGRILLIENARSSNSFLGLYQDLTASAAAKVGGKGCVSNQDVKSFIKETDRLKIQAENEFASGVFRSYICVKN